MGSEGGVCYNTLTCNSGLICIDMICKKDPCYNVECESWKTCNNGMCILKKDRCDKYEDCNNENAICDSNHYCITDTNPCEGVTCSGHGICLIDSVTKQAVCNCNEGYNNNLNKLECVKNEEPNPCENKVCENWEQCNQNTGECEIIPGKCGNDRDCIGDKICNNHDCLDPVNPCEGVTCSGHGTCVIDPNTDLVSCNCDIENGYFPSGLNCINPCRGHENCEGYGECKPTSATDATCQCIEGYIPQGLKCVEHDLCAGNTCAEWKPCDPDTGACVLSEGRCETDNDCGGDMICNEDHNCVNMQNPCENQDCSGHGTCVVANGSALCNCDVNNGYYPNGLNCLNPCENQDCSGHGTCIPSNAVQAVCNCEEGYHATGMTCIENDPCENITCQNSWEECVNGVCTLKDGMCEDNSDCPTNAPACVNNHCKNLCDDLNCGQHGQCVSDANQAVCVCNEGYNGDLCNTCASGYQDHDNNGTCEPYLMWCKLQSPLSITQNQDTEGELVFARVYVEGITETTDQEGSETIKAQLGYTPYNVTYPIIEGNYFWIDATYNPSCASCETNNDEYMVNFPTDMAGTFKYLYRFSTNNGNTWLYCDSNGSGGINNDPFETDKVGTATINGTPQNPITDLFISEYIEGATGNNKAIEIYNGTENTIDLSNYEIWKISNSGNWAESKLQLSGTLNPGEVYVICHKDENLLPDVCDLKEYSITSFNGNDAIGLAKKDGNGNFQLIDAVGTEGGAPDEGWDVAGITAATKDHVLRRKATVFQGNTDWDSSRGTNETDSEWIVLDDDFSNLGSFTPSE